jgi:sulfur carrier protein
MITISINGQQKHVSEGCYLHQLIEEDVGTHLAHIAVVVNETIIPKSLWQTHQCKAGDHIELFSAVAGG